MPACCFSTCSHCCPHCHSSLQYCMKWKRPMYQKRSSRRLSKLQKASKKSPKKSSLSDEEVVQRRLKGQRRRTGQRKDKGAGDAADKDEGMVRDIIDIINTSCDAEEENEGKAIEISDTGLDESDEDRISECSVASGPNFSYCPTPKKPRPSQSLCSACRKLYQKAKRIKAPTKNKLLDNDPKSLTCDQWVLIKKWTPKRLPNSRGKLLVKKLWKQWGGVEASSSSCSRPHAFLQRNLRRRVNVPTKKEKKNRRRKRARADSEGPRVAKQRRLQSNDHYQHISISHSSPEQEAISVTDNEESVELIPSSLTLERAKPKAGTPKRKAQKNRGFKNLLDQLRGNSSMIIKEKR
ncbi:uncharacterized protein si:ch211-227n13.3 isoform X2 [Mugil cephalus]|uniref:uncharacterized protein si:ch211-227n13.3 isoform X2 n=1 Tax=Mugil cephalus TaxID=48193 RepID=UPI001FB84E89|nr:uncharacterized protein si:ch211-227n13.3 isoform X2 [Mugil cephalus]